MRKAIIIMIFSTVYGTAPTSCVEYTRAAYQCVYTPAGISLPPPKSRNGPLHPQPSVEGLRPPPAILGTAPGAADRPPRHQRCVQTRSHAERTERRSRRACCATTLRTRMQYFLARLAPPPAPTKLHLPTLESSAPECCGAPLSRVFAAGASCELISTPCCATPPAGQPPPPFAPSVPLGACGA